MTNSERDQRLAAKLRENLKRRKAQLRARRAGEAIGDEADKGKKTEAAGKAAKPPPAER